MVKAAAVDKTLVTDILSRSFEANKSVNYIVKNDNKRLFRIRALMAYSFDVCLAFGEVWLSEDRKACALILYPQQKTTTIRSAWLDIKLIFRAIGIGGIKKALDREQKIKAKQEKVPMYYLWFIGVAPESQHKGTGSSLLKEVLADADDKGLAVYLETSTLKNLPWYEDLGFKIYDKLELGYNLFFLKRERRK